MEEITFDLFSVLLLTGADLQWHTYVASFLLPDLDMIDNGTFKSVSIVMLPFDAYGMMFTDQ